MSGPYPRPCLEHIGVYGVIKKANSILVIKKTRGPYTGMYDLPGGKIEPGETPEEALLREIKEETGIVAIEWSLWRKMSHVEERVFDEGMIDFKHIGHLYTIESYDDGKLSYEVSFEDSGGCMWISSTTKERVTPFLKKALTSFTLSN